MFMVIGFIKSLFGSKTKRKISDIMERLSHPTMDDFKQQVGTFAHLTTEAERELAIARKKAEIAMPNIKRAYVNKKIILKLKAKFWHYTNTRQALAKANDLALRQQFFLEDLVRPLNRAYFSLLEARKIFLLKDDPEINAIAGKIEEVERLAEAYHEQLADQCAELSSRKANPDIRQKPELWEEQEKIGRLDKMLTEILGGGFEKLDERIRYLVSAQNVMEKFSIRVQEITARIQQIIDSIIQGEFVYYNDSPVSKNNFFIIIIESSYSVTVSFEKSGEFLALANRLEVEAGQLEDLRDSFIRACTKTRFPEGVPGAKEVDEDIKILTDRIRMAKSSIDNIINSKQYKYAA